MHKLVGACLAMGLVVSTPVLADQLGFADPPPEQSLVRPGEEPKPQPVQQQPVQQSAAQPVQQQSQPQQPMRMPAQQRSRSDSDNAFFLKPTYVSQEDFNIFKRQVVQVLKDNQDKTAVVSKQLLDMKIEVQRVGPQMNSLKQMMLQMSKLLPNPGQQNPVAAVAWQQWWFWLFAAWSALLTLVVLYLLLIKRKRPVADNGPDNGGDYDFMSGADSVPAHMELAKTYLAMQDYAHARRSLEFVVMHDSGELKQQALKLLKQLAKKG